jgi:hypothetical protein
MSDTPRVDAKTKELDLSGPEQYENYIEMAILARTLEGELNIANKIIADARDYVEEFRDFFPDDGLLAILERKVTC